MSTRFDLVISADSPRLMAEFRLLDEHGVQIGFRQTDFRLLGAGRLQSLFDLRDFLHHYVEEGREAAAVADTGVCIAEDVLGAEIFERLWKPRHQRTLRIRLPGASEAENHLAAALARVPWEVARPAADQETLGERNLLVRVVHDTQAPPDTTPIDLRPDEALRVLFVFAEARGSRPLGARQERLDLTRLFEQDIYPQRRVVAHFLTHGVTRERLESQIRDHGGYHVVHWSGHGHLNLLELAKSGGAGDRISGQDLLDLFLDAGGFLPRLVFLSACHSGDILRVKDWNDFIAVAQGREPGGRQDGTSGNDADSGDGARSGTSALSAASGNGGASPAVTPRQLDLAEQPGFTGTAHALLQGGVPSVVAMRYAVGDDYARELAVGFYRALLADAQPKHVASALTQARLALLDPRRPGPARFAVCDHATPVLYGAEQPGLTLARGRSPEASPPDPRLHRIAELNSASHAHFVGRTWELAGLGADFIGSSAGAEVRPVAVITGLGGMGKTALVAEALALWERRFDWVLLYQAKPEKLGFEATLRDIDLKLRGELGRYHEHVKAVRPADALYRDADASAGFTGDARLERLTWNLVRALKDEAILLVLDNFETNLKPQGDDGSAAVACQDPAWDRCLRLLAQELAGSRSRVLVTCRRPLAALAEPNGSAGSAAPALSVVSGGSAATAACTVPLGPLPAFEAALYLRAHPALSRMIFGTDAAERALAMRLLDASRFHPLLMDRLARLASDAKLRPQLLHALDTVEKTKAFAQLPDLFAGGVGSSGDAKEREYLQDALISSLDQLIRDCSPDARRLLWVISLANEPVTLGLLTGLWSGESRESEEQAQLRQIKEALDNLAQLPAELQEQLKAMPPELRAMIDALPPAPPTPATRPDPVLLLRHLIGVGLVTEERTGPEDENPAYACHELVRERICAWMEQRSQDRGDRTENAVRLAYAERLEAVFHALQHQDMTAALQAGSRALVYCVQAGAWERLSGFASRLVTSTPDPGLLERLIPYLQIAAEAAPKGELRWSCLCSLADALNRGGRPDASLPFYEQAVRLARAAAEAGGEDSLQASADLGGIASNWALALRHAGHLDTARQQQLESASAQKQAGKPAVNVISSELEALRIDIMQGKAAVALPQIEARLEQVAAWWQRQRSGQLVPEAPDAEFLARAFISALGIVLQADYAREDWESALRRIDATLEVERDLKRPAQDIGSTRMNRAIVLMEMPGRLGEAKAELEACLRLFENDPTRSAK